jgi:hypothetical protein
MKKTSIMAGCLFSITLLVLAGFPSVVGYQAIRETRQKTLLSTRITQLFSHLQQRSLKTWNPGSILITLFFKLLVGLVLFEVGFQLYWMIQEAEPFTIQWFLVLPYIVVIVAVELLVMLMIGIALLPAIIVVLLSTEAFR